MSNMLLKESTIFSNWEDEEAKKSMKIVLEWIYLKRNKDLRYENKKVMKMNNKLSEVLENTIRL